VVLRYLQWFVLIRGLCSIAYAVMR